MIKESLIIVPKQETGQSLIEILASMTVIIVVLIGIIIATTYSLKSITFSKNQTLATKYAQEGLENVRKARDSDPETFWERIVDGTVNDGHPDEKEFFTRQIQYYIEELGGKMTVTVTVEWTDSSGSHQAKQSSIFTRW